jgi:uncharacterized protein YlxW (UPF0749 family)
VGQDGNVTDRPITARPRTDGSMSLLVDTVGSALDPAYAEAARRHAEPGAASSPSSRPAALVAVVLCVGLVTGTAVSQVRQEAGQAEQVRQSLVEEIRSQTRATDALATQAATLRQEVAAVQQQALGQGSAGRAAADQLAALELITGGTAVRGPGLVVALDDAPNATGADGRVADGRIFDRDVQDVVNALWAAGAEAISINGQRLTAQTAIRSAGEAVLVDLRPLSPPYVLRAVGGVDDMEPAFVDGATARRFKTWTSFYGITFTVERASRLELPAASGLALRAVVPR